MPHVSYPNSLDLASASFVFQTIKAKTIVENKVAFAHHIWGLTGYLLRTVVGVPEGHPTNYGDTQAGPPAFNEEESAVLQQVCNECSDMLANPISMTDEDPISGFDISALLALLPIILQLLSALGINFGGDTTEGENA